MSGITILDIWKKQKMLISLGFNFPDIRNSELTDWLINLLISHVYIKLHAGTGYNTKYNTVYKIKTNTMYFTYTQRGNEVEMTSYASLSHILAVHNMCVLGLR